MTAYLVRRAGVSIVVLAGISVVIFFLLHLMYAPPSFEGFHGPWFEQYLQYVDQLVHGNLGWSQIQDQSVAALFGERWPRTAYFVGVPLAIAVGVSVPLGIYQAARRGTAGDAMLTTVTFTTYAMPSYFLYLVAIQIFAFSLHLFSYEASQFTAMWAIVGDWHAMALPIACQVLPTVAWYARYMRASALDALAQDYIVAARAKGLPERLVLWRHLTRNAFLPMITLIGLSVPALLAGNVIAEYVWNYPGLGLLF